MADYTTNEHLKVKIEELNSYCEKLGNNTRFHIDKDMTGSKLVNQNYHEFTQKRNSKTELYDKLYTVNEILRTLLQE